MLYANGFLNGIGLTDAYLILLANGRSVGVVNMSLSLAKTLAQNLSVMVEEFEKQTGETIPTLDELQNRDVGGLSSEGGIGE